MVREGEDRLDDLHRKTLEIVENAVEEGETPVVRVRVIMDHPDIDVTKPTVHSRIDDLVEWGYLDRMKVGRAFVLWPANKYEDMAERLDELEGDKEYLERRVSELEEEREEAHEEAAEARARAEAAREEAVEKLKEAEPTRVQKFGNAATTVMKIAALAIAIAMSSLIVNQELPIIAANDLFVYGLAFLLVAAFVEAVSWLYQKIPEGLRAKIGQLQIPGR